MNIHSHYHLLRMKEMGRIYWCHSVGAFGVSLAAIFIPIYLLKIGYSFSDVLIYVLFQQIFVFVFQYPVSLLMQYLRPHHMLALGSFFYSILFGMLLTMQAYYWPITSLAFIWALNRSIYWTGFHYNFSLARRHEHSGNQIAGLNALVILTTTAAPAIGGFVATLFGINYIYWAAIIILVIASIPMLSLSSGPSPTKLRMTWRQLQKMQRDAFANFFNGVIMMAEQSVWPIFIYLIVTSYAGIGLLSSVIAIAGITTALYVGRKEEKRGEHHYIRQGTIAYGASSLIRGLVQNSSQIFGLNLLSGIGRSLYVTPFLNRYYHNSDGDYRLGYITIMEGSAAFGGALYIGLLLLLAVILPVKTVLIVGLALVALLASGVRLIR